MSRSLTAPAVSRPSPSVAPVALRLRWAIGNALLPYQLYLTWARKKTPNKVVGPDTDLVIEGFPRSGNTFAVTAFRLAQPGPMKVASHLHASSHVGAAVGAGVPTLVLVRDPIDAVTSLTVFWGGRCTVEQALRYYVRFYQRVLPYVDRSVVASFDQVTTDLGAVIGAVNERFGTSFEKFENTEANVARAFELIEEEMLGRRGRVNESSIPRPSSHRRESSQRVRAEAETASLASLRAEAYRLHDRFMGLRFGVRG